MSQPRNDIGIRFEISLANGDTAISKEFTISYAYSYQTWLEDNKIGSADAALDKSIAGDGMTNLQKYASNLPARTACSQGQVADYRASGGVASLTYNFYKFANVSRTFQWSNNLIDWNDVPEQQLQITQSGVMLSITFSRQYQQSEPLFMRVKIDSAN